MLLQLHNVFKSSVQLSRRLYHCTTKLVFSENLPAIAYKPELVEKDKYAQWEAKGGFKPEETSSEPNFSMVLPPPNVTGKLHLGHALGCAIQDAIVRRQRSMGRNVLWMPGTDHAGIATQNVVEKYLNTAMDVQRHDLGKERFNVEVWSWKKKHGDVITNQLRQLGCSLDWSREHFTMDLNHNAAVNHAFIQLFNRGLIYRKKALVNWSTALKSTVSDMEVESLKIDEPTQFKLPDYDKPVMFGQMYEFAYKVFGSNQEIIVSTTMPETMLGDVAIAVNPNDDRYHHLAGKVVFHPFRNTTIPIISDEFVDMKLGTGAVKITPAHSKVDYDVAKEHDLPMVQVIDENGKIINSGKFNGMKQYDCREEILGILQKIGSLKSVAPHEMTLPICSRSGDIITHLPKDQWFVSCKKMNERAREAVLNGQLEIKPGKFIKNWLDWTGDERDWCISRQLWWGHQIPAYKCTSNKDIIWIAALDEIEARERAAHKLDCSPTDLIVERDPDVLDTWFSSGIYPFAALGWPDRTKDYHEFYPLSLMVTGHDILGFWVHKMVMLGQELTDRLPFKNILLHGIVCDSKGAKMSKSKGNVIDPIDVVKGVSMEKLKEKSEAMYTAGILSKNELKKALSYHRSNFAHTDGIPRCGADAFRFTLLSQDIKSHFVNFDVSMCHANKLFGNKIWQSVKYTRMACGKLVPTSEELTLMDLTYFDKWILSRLADMVTTVNQNFENYDFHLATRALRNLVYADFCDVYLEATKPGFVDRNIKIGYAHAHTLTAVLNTALRCLNPFMVHLTEELIPCVPAFEHNIIVNYEDIGARYYNYPQYSDVSEWKNNELEGRVGKVISAAALVREIKGLCGMNNRVKPSIYVKTTNDTLKSDVAENASVVRNLAQCCAVDFQHSQDKHYIRGVLDNESEVFIEILGTDVESAISAAKMKLQSKIDKLESNLLMLEKKITSQQYVSSIPEWTKTLDTEKLLAQREQLRQLQKDLSDMQS